MYIVAISETEFKLVRDLPEEPNSKYNYLYTEWVKETQQAISDAPFVKNKEVAAGLIWNGSPFAIYEGCIRKFDLSDYEVSEPEMYYKTPTIDWSLVTSNIPTTTYYEHRKFVTITKKEDGVHMAKLKPFISEKHSGWQVKAEERVSKEPTPPFSAGSTNIKEKRFYYC